MKYHQQSKLAQFMGCGITMSAWVLSWGTANTMNKGYAIIANLTANAVRERIATAKENLLIQPILLQSTIEVVTWSIFYRNCFLPGCTQKGPQLGILSSIPSLTFLCCLCVGPAKALAA